MTNAVANLSLTPHSGGGGGATKPEFTKYLGLPRVCPGQDWASVGSASPVN